MLKNYPGHKNTTHVYQAIVNQIPKFETYYELFAGSAAIATIVCNENDSVILNEKDAEVQQQLIAKVKPWTVYNLCAIEIIKNKEFRFDKGSFVFLDPPYLHETRTDKNLYKCELSDSDHVQLLTAVRDLNCNVMIIHPKCDLYDTMLHDWRKVEVKIRYHRKTSECLYMNYELPDELHKYDFIGNDCWDRQRIKRKGDRMISKLLSLPVLERKYIFGRIDEMREQF